MNKEVPTKSVAQIFEEQGFDIEAPISWWRANSDIRLSLTLQLLKNHPVHEVFNFIADNLEILRKLDAVGFERRRIAEIERTGRHTMIASSVEEYDEMNGEFNKIILTNAMNWYRENVLGLELSEI